jgi:hypothetical protein
VNGAPADANGQKRSRCLHFLVQRSGVQIAQRLQVGWNYRRIANEQVRNAVALAEGFGHSVSAG